MYYQKTYEITVTNLEEDGGRGGFVVSVTRHNVVGYPTTTKNQYIEEEKKIKPAITKLFNKFLAEDKKEGDL